MCPRSFVRSRANHASEPQSGSPIPIKPQSSHRSFWLVRGRTLKATSQ
ncbi:hypothetical protein ACFPRL_04860 [Pseudoclavibacter helvolus]